MIMMNFAFLIYVMSKILKSLSRFEFLIQKISKIHIMNILITNANSRMALCIARAVKKLKHNVIVGDYVSNSLSFYSNKIDKKLLYPSPYSEPHNFIEQILLYCKNNNIDMIIPVGEETFLFSKYVHLFTSIKIIIPKYESIISVHDKENLYNNLVQLGIKTPVIQKLNKYSNYEDIRKDFTGNVLLKPRQGGGNWGVFFLNPEISYTRQINSYLSETKIDYSRILVQEFIPVKQKFSHAVLYNKGIFIQDYADLHIRDFPLSGGAGVLRSSCDSYPMRGPSKKIFDFLSWNGVAEVEYIQHAKTGEYYLIEINPRIWGGVNSAIYSGINIPEFLINISTEHNMAYRTYNFGIKTRWFWGDCRVFNDYMKKVGINQATKEFLCLFFDNTKSDEFYWDDPLPFFVWPMHVLYKMIKYRTLKPVAYDSLTDEWM
jgi:predicted ATP-grasp superfamily ATP-dependent carboligase